jgi:hypothetical protein
MRLKLYSLDQETVLMVPLRCANLTRSAQNAFGHQYLRLAILPIRDLAEIMADI